ncbi:hypothetical protein ACJ72_04969 [Emergomyces africanus]|uniref:Antigenic thaumatin-like protein n=1 Tax=Emergomyces africanus TaxID=1955775 RepID=A0A1B7NV92_9EURO|nr:hypothetical protein ACJ72_04969 [Emergomyces africanus]
MYIKGALAAAAAFSALPSALAGTASVKNNCDCPVYLWSVANLGNVPRHTINPGETYVEEYRTNPNGGGISLKISKNYSDLVITQFEYTLAGPKVFYDVSNINGYPFVDFGVSLASPSGSCPAVHCPPGVKLCKGAYNNPDDIATLACSSSQDLTMILCPTGAQQSQQEITPTATTEQQNPSATKPPQQRPQLPPQRHPRQFSV